MFRWAYTRWLVSNDVKPFFGKDGEADETRSFSHLTEKAQLVRAPVPDPQIWVRILGPEACARSSTKLREAGEVLRDALEWSEISSVAPPGAIAGASSYLNLLFPCKAMSRPRVSKTGGCRFEVLPPCAAVHAQTGREQRSAG
jgi:hypothetical protein